MRLLIALVIAAVLPATAAAQAPVTGEANPVGTTTAVLNGTVPPSTEWHFEYGTTSVYGAQTAPETTGPGTADVAVSAQVGGLSPSTTYHYRLVAGGVTGEDRTFTTAAATAAPAAPGISRLSAVEKTTSSARLTARVDPNRAATTYYMEWGTTTRLGNRTPEATLPARDGGVPVSAPLSGLPSHTKIYWRVVATNAAGVKRSGIASFTTLRAPTGITLSLFPEVALWSDSVTISGRVQGAGVNGLTVVLQQATFPYSAGFADVATARTGKTGSFRFAPRQVLLASRFRAFTRTAVSVASTPVEALVRPRVGIRRTRKTRRSLVLTGRVNPGLPDGRATLQRRTPRGGWALVRRRALRTADTTTSSYRFKVRRLRRAAVYRVKIAPNDGGAHLGGTSRALRVAKRRGR